jgi:ABC-type glutathione transport system ATPase component
MQANPPLLDLRISVDYPRKRNVLRDVPLEIRAGEIFGLVGESGSGKSTLAMAVLGLLKYQGAAVKGQIVFRGRDLNPMTDGELRRIRGREIGLTPQSPMSALNPMLSIETQLWEAWRAHSSSGKDVFLSRARQLLTAVRLPEDPEFLRRKPGQLSVGQVQRVLLAMAMLHQPSLLIADEPTSALDLISRSSCIQLLRHLNECTSMAILLISHDLPAVAAISDRAAVLNDGEIIESGVTREVFEHPRHPHAKSLVGTMSISRLAGRPNNWTSEPAVSPFR